MVTTPRTVTLTIAKLTAFLPVLLFAVPITLGAQQAPGPKTAKVGLFLGGTVTSPGVQIEPFKQVLRERGWV